MFLHRTFQWYERWRKLHLYCLSKSQMRVFEIKKKRELFWNKYEKKYKSSCMVTLFFIIIPLYYVFIVMRKPLYMYKGVVDQSFLEFFILSQICTRYTIHSLTFISWFVDFFSFWRMNSYIFKQRSFEQYQFLFGVTFPIASSSF